MFSHHTKNVRLLILINVFGDHSLEQITNARLCNLMEKTLRYRIVWMILLCHLSIQDNTLTSVNFLELGYCICCLLVTSLSLGKEFIYHMAIFENYQALFYHFLIEIYIYSTIYLFIDFFNSLIHLFNYLLSWYLSIQT